MRAGRVLRWVRARGAEAWRRVDSSAPQVLQTTFATTAAWLIAVRVAGHPQPFFAPISAVVALTAARGERGTTAVRLLLGVVVGILAGDLVMAVLGRTPWTMPVAVFVAMTAASALHTVRIILVQSAASAILTVVFAGTPAGSNRLVDALIGAGVALLVVQVLFPPDPVRLLRRAVTAALSDLASGLEEAALALESGDEDAERRARERLWEENERLNELAQARVFSSRIAHRVPLRRTLIPRVRKESENASSLNLLNVSCVLLTRAAFSLAEPDRERFAPVVRDLADALDGLAAHPDDHEARQTAADRALAAVRPLAERPSVPHPSLTTAVMAARMVAVDLMMFAGVAPEDALAAVRTGRGEPGVPPPPR